MSRDVVYRSRTMKAIYQSRKPSWGKVAKNPVLKVTCLTFANTKALPYALRISPVGRTGVYRKSWRVKPGTVVVNGFKRVCANLINYADHSAAVEFGNRTTPHPQRILGLTIAHLYRTGPK